LLPVRCVAQVTAAVARVTSSCDGCRRPTPGPTPVSVSLTHSHCFLVDGLMLQRHRSLKPRLVPPNLCNLRPGPGIPTPTGGHRMSAPAFVLPWPRSPDTGRRRRDRMLVCDSRRAGYLRASTACNQTPPTVPGTKYCRGRLFLTLLAHCFSPTPPFVIVLHLSHLEPAASTEADVQRRGTKQYHNRQGPARKRRRIDSESGGAITGPSPHPCPSSAIGAATSLRTSSSVPPRPAARCPLGK
jgi:hypothetical protein